jgi:hypothetical protein
MALPATTSGTYTWVYTAGQIATRALRQVGAIEAGETPDAQDLNDTIDALNAWIKERQAAGIHVWTQEEALLWLQPNQYYYQLGAGSPDVCADWQSWYQTSLGAAANSGAAALSVASISNLAANQNIGVVLSTGPLFWTTIAGAAAGSTVNLAAPLPAPAASGAAVYAFAPPAQGGANIIRPLRVPFARRYQFQSASGSPIETPMVVMSRRDYMDLPNKVGATGTPSQWYYDPRIGSGLQGPGFLAAWVSPVDVTSGIRFTWYRPIQDIANATELPDLPVEWTQALVRNLALDIAVEYDVSPQRYQILERRAQQSLDIVTGWDEEPESTFMGAAMDPTAR